MRSEHSDYLHLRCGVLLVCADALHPDQLQRMRDGESGLGPLTEEKIDDVLTSWKRKLMREIGKHDGFVVLGYDA